DLYWAQGGNPDLIPESGWSEEFGLTHKHSYKKFAWELGATAFNRNIDNWIIWLPDQYGIWAPDKVLRDWSTGLEYKDNMVFNSGKFNLTLSGMYNYVLSTNDMSVESGEATAGKQLIYVPIQNASGHVTVSYRSTTVSYTHCYTGFRYTSSDNKKFLKPYDIANLRVSQSIPMNHSSIKIYVQWNNMYNETYQVLAYMAMPQMNYQAGIILNLNKPSKNQ
nr:TonB-dependent receptor [Bacteroidota bacterium]